MEESIALHAHVLAHFKHYAGRPDPSSQGRTTGAKSLRRDEGGGGMRREERGREDGAMLSSKQVPHPRRVGETNSKEIPLGKEDFHDMKTSLCQAPTCQ